MVMHQSLNSKWVSWTTMTFTSLICTTRTCYSHKKIETKIFVGSNILSVLRYYPRNWTVVRRGVKQGAVRIIHEFKAADIVKE
jgi:hypothetical protein